MNEQEYEALVEETRELIDDIEGGRPEHAGWVAIQDRVRRMQAPGTADERSKAQVAKDLRQSPTWVKDVLRWDRRTSDATPFSRGSRPGRREGVEQAEAKKVLRDPESRAKVIESLTPEERAEVAQTIRAKEVQGAEPGLREAVEKVKDREFDEMARKQVEKAYDALRARVHYYGNVPINDTEREELGWIVDLAQYLRGESSLDDELKEMIESAESK